MQNDCEESSFQCALYERYAASAFRMATDGLIENQAAREIIIFLNGADLQYMQNKVSNLDRIKVNFYLWYNQSEIVGVDREILSASYDGLSKKDNTVIEHIKRLFAASAQQIAQEAAQKAQQMLEKYPELKDAEKPHSRHEFDKIKSSSYTAEKNTVIDKGVDIDKDIQDIRNGDFKIIEGGQIEVNGRVYARHGDGSNRLIPVRGEGFTELSGPEYEALGLLKKYGYDNPEAYRLIAFRKHITSQHIEKAIEVILRNI
jgi:hypothetical protein